MSSSESGSSETTSSTNTETSAAVAYLDGALWHRFSEALSPGDFARSWLALQVSMLAKVSHGVVVLGPAEQGPFVPAAAWPEGDKMPGSLSRAAESAMAERRGVLHRAKQSGGATSQMAYPLLVDERLFGVVALEFSDSSEAELSAMMRQLQWGCGWFEAYLRRSAEGGSSDKGERLSRLLDLTAIALEHDRFRAAAMALVTKLAISNRL